MQLASYTDRCQQTGPLKNHAWSTTEFEMPLAGVSPRWTVNWTRWSLSVKKVC